MASRNQFPKLHNAMWPGLVGKGGPDAEPYIPFEKMLDLTAEAEVDGVRFDGVDIFLFAPHTEIDSSDDDLKRLAEQVARLGTSIPAALAQRLTLLNQRLTSQQALLAAVSHENVLARGFSITRMKKGRKIVRSVSELTDRQRLVTQLSDGEFDSEAINIRQRELFE